VRRDAGIGRVSNRRDDIVIFVLDLVAEAKADLILAFITFIWVGVDANIGQFDKIIGGNITYGYEIKLRHKNKSYLSGKCVVIVSR
jgi:hypothetical protein